MSWKTFKLLYRKFIQDSVYQILSELTGFCGRYDKNILLCFFRFTVESECTSHNLSLFVIILPKIMKISGNLTKFWQKQFCTVFFETRCIVLTWDWSLLYGVNLWLVVIVQTLNLSDYVSSWHTVRQSLRESSVSCMSRKTHKKTSATRPRWRLWERGNTIDTLVTLTTLMLTPCLSFYTVNQKKTEKCFLIYSLQNLTDCDRIWYVLSE